MTSFAETLAVASRPGPRRAHAFEHLLRPLLFPVRRYLRAQVGEPAEDLIDEVLLSVWEHLHGFHGTESQFRSWIFTIAHNLVVDHHRRRRDEHPLELVAAHPAANDTESEALARVAEGELRRRGQGPPTPRHRSRPPAHHRVITGERRRHCGVTRSLG